MRGLSTSIDATTNIPSVVERARAGFVSFEKQVAGIGARFSTGFKDIFLGFFAPMALFQTAMGYITDGIAKAKQDAQDGLDLLAKGETIYASSEEKKTAAFFKAKAEREKELELVKKGKESLGRTFAETEAGNAAVREYIRQNPSAVSLTQAGPNYESMFLDPKFQDYMIKEFLKTPEGKAYQPIFGDKKDAAFKGPEGFSNVIGVGPSPVLEAMSRQTDIQEQILEHLKSMAPSAGRLDLPDFTKQAPLTLLKSGNV